MKLKLFTLGCLKIIKQVIYLLAVIYVCILISFYISTLSFFKVQNELMVEKRNIFEQELDREVKVYYIIRLCKEYYVRENVRFHYENIYS